MSDDVEGLELKIRDEERLLRQVQNRLKSLRAARRALTGERGRPGRRSRHFRHGTLVERVLEVLGAGAAPLRTSALADAVHGRRTGISERDAIYTTCKRLAGKGRLVRRGTSWTLEQEPAP